MAVKRGNVERVMRWIKFLKSIFALNMQQQVLQIPFKFFVFIYKLQHVVFMILTNLYQSLSLLNKCNLVHELVMRGHIGGVL